MSFWEESSEPVSWDRKGRVRRERAGLSVVLVVVVVLALLLGIAYAAAHAVVGDRVPRDTTISGVDVGGLSRDDAIAQLDAVFSGRAKLPITFAAVDASGAERSVVIRPDQVGLQVDATASVDAVDPGRSWRPQRIWEYFSGAGPQQAVVSIDQDALAARVRTMAGGIGAPPVNGRITFTRTGAHAEQGTAGDAVGLADAVQAFEAAYLSGARKAQVAIRPAQPDIDHVDLTDAMIGFAQPAMSAPVVLKLGPRTLRLQPRQYAAALSMVPQGGRLVPRIAAGRVLGLVRPARAPIAPRDATVTLVGGRPRVVPSRPGLTFSDDAVVAAFTRALTAKGAHRTVTVAAHRAQPALTTAAVQRLRVKQRVAGFSAYFPAASTSPREARRITAAAHRLDGRLLRPGQVLSLGAQAGPLASATFGAAFFAGLEDLTPDQPIVVDPNGSASGLRFRNDTGYGVLVHVTTTPVTPGHPGRVAVALWSTRRWDVTARKGAHTSVVRPKLQVSYAADCRPSPGVPGYEYAVTRVFRKPGQKAVDHTEQLHAVHAPVDRLVCR